ncbi:MAG: preprotein translocase subunit SecE [Clostridia bacterium]|nr:preprotein translocase subunit SecE [Clostridia bacterium]
MFRKIKDWFIDMKAEFKKVVWPKFAKVRQNTFIVILFVIIVGAIIWILDWLFNLGFTALLTK